MEKAGDDELGLLNEEFECIGAGNGSGSELGYEVFNAGQGIGLWWWEGRWR